jgi:hypothetical protein
MQYGDPHTVGFVMAGTAPTLAVFTSCLISPRTAIGILTAISRPIDLASFHGLSRLVGNAAWPNRALGWTYAVIFAVLIPIAFFCIPPLAVGVTWGRVAGFFETSRSLKRARHVNTFVRYARRSDRPKQPTKSLRASV